MARIEYINDVNGSFQEAHGSDNRLNVSARSDNRAYYNSRDSGRCFTLAYDHQSAVAGEYSIYWQNTDTTGRDLVISSVGLNSAEASRIKLQFVTGTAAGGTVVTPLNTNGGKSNAASATCRQGASGDAITGLTTAGTLDFAYVQATGHEEMRLTDRVRLGQNDAIALRYDEGTTGDFAGVIFAYYE
jgi:hypothetical protein